MKTGLASVITVFWAKGVHYSGIPYAIHFLHNRAVRERPLSHPNLRFISWSFEGKAEHTLPNNHIQDEATSTSSTPSTPAVSTPAQTPKPDVAIAGGSQQDISVDQVDIMLISPKQNAIASPDHLSSIQPTSRTPSYSNSEVDSFTHTFDVASDLIHVDGAHFQSTPKRRTSSATPMCSPGRNLSNLSREPTEIILNGVMDGLNLQSSYSPPSSSQIHFKSSTRSRASTLRSTQGSDASRRRGSRRRKREHILKDAVSLRYCICLTRFS